MKGTFSYGDVSMMQGRDLTHSPLRLNKKTKKEKKKTKRKQLVPGQGTHDTQRGQLEQGQDLTHNPLRLNKKIKFKEEKGGGV